MTKNYIPWNALENDESDGIDKIHAYCDNLWKDLSVTLLDAG